MIVSSYPRQWTTGVKARRNAPTLTLACTLLNFVNLFEIPEVWGEERMRFRQHTLSLSQSRFSPSTITMPRLTVSPILS